MVEPKYIVDGIALAFIGAALIVALYGNQQQFAGVALGILGGYLGARGSTVLTAPQTTNDKEDTA